MNYQAAKATLNGKEQKKVDHNTWLRQGADGDIKLVLHDTAIVTFHNDDTMTFDVGSFFTHTTKDRLNKFSPFPVYQEKHHWYIYINGQKTQFYNGLTIECETGELVRSVPQKDIEVLNEQDKDLDKKIKAYTEALTIEKCQAAIESASGDCLMCLWKTEQGETLGEAFNDKEHLFSHMEEEYYPLNLLARAYETEHALTNNNQDRRRLAFDIHLDHLDRIQHALKKYLQRRLSVSGRSI